MEVVLVMFKADGERRSFPLTRDVTVIGRREDCDLRIPLTEVSRKHCRLIKEAEGVRLEDLGSSNGTFHNGTRVHESPVQPGDKLQIGPVVFTVQIDGFPADEAIVPPSAPEPDDSSAGSNSVLDSSHSSSSGSESSRTVVGNTLGNRPLAPQGDDLAPAADDHDTGKSRAEDVMDILSPAPDETNEA